MVSTGVSKNGQPIWRKAGASDISVRLGNWAAYCMDWFEAYEHGIIAQFAPEARAKIEIRTER